MMLRAVHKYTMREPRRLICWLLPALLKNLAVECLRRGTPAAAYSTRVSRSRGKSGTRIAFGIGGFYASGKCFFMKRREEYFHHLPL